MRHAHKGSWPRHKSTYNVIVSSVQAVASVLREERCVGLGLCHSPEQRTRTGVSVSGIVQEGIHRN